MAGGVWGLEGVENLDRCGSGDYASPGPSRGVHIEASFGSSVSLDASVGCRLHWLFAVLNPVRSTRHVARLRTAQGVPDGICWGVKETHRSISLLSVVTVV